MNAPSAAHRTLCFVLMPFGTKTDAQGNTINFDDVYRQFIKPAIEAAGLEPLRADEESAGGFIHKPMYERLLLCEYAVADLTAANANVFYELGVRHAMRPGSTIMLFAQGGRLPFDVAALRTLPYQLGPAGSPAAPEADQLALTSLLNAAQQEAHENERGHTDSPLYQILENYPHLDTAHTDSFRQQVNRAATIRQQLAAACANSDLAAVQALDAGLGELGDEETGVLIDLLQAYRSLQAWPDVLGLMPRLPRPLFETTLVQEHYGFALNRARQRQKAEQVLLAVLERQGPSSETLGLLGRIYKDQWQEARDQGNKFVANALLKKATDTYLRGFETDLRDAYPGINAVTLMEQADQVDPRQAKVLPVVRYAAERKLGATPGYWDYATLLELAVLADNQADAADYLGQALSTTYEPRSPASTAGNLRLIRQARERRGQDAAWIAELEAALVVTSDK